MNIGAFGENFPYTNFHDLNLDWILKTLKELKEQWQNFDALNSIIVADPALWNPQTVYKKNTIVVDSNGNGYISTNTTIPGAQLTDPNYWRLVFPYGVSVSELEERVREAIAEQNQHIEDAIEEQNEYIERSTLKNIQNRYFLICGDSYVVYYGNNLYNKILEYGQMDTTKCFNAAVSGASFHDTQNSFISQIQNFSGDKNAITDILVIGGINDATLAMPANRQALELKIAEFKSYVSQNYPNAVIWGFYCGSCLANSQYYATHNADSQEWVRYAWYNNNEANIFNYVSIPFLNTLPGNFASDGVHPTAAAQNMIASRIVNALKGQPNFYSIPTYASNMYGSGATVETGIVANANMRIDNDIAQLTISSLSLHITTGTVLNRSTETEIATLNQFLVKKPVYVPGYLFLNRFSADHNYDYIKVVFIFKDGKLYITPKEILEGSGWISYTAIDSNESTITLTMPMTITTSLENIN